ncbi:hypothetical protein SNE40_005108 [Patella caerulea]|uniref:Chitin-binding type-2 domain-containing protein n=1 Tax=Patella caerulea TaxID=87958 RepID=A0AAN8K4F2_PATCE
MKVLVLSIILLVETLGCEIGEYSFLRHSDCTKFSTCLNGVLEVLRCGNGLHWSERRTACLSPAFANCTNGAETPKDPAIESDTECRNGKYLFLRHPECTKCQICVNGVLRVSNCSDGRHWSVSTGSCVSPGIANCQTETTEQPVTRRTYPTTGCTHGEYRRHPECTKFLQCSHGVLYVHDCAPGTHWSVSVKNCVWPDIANCKPITNAEPTTNTAKTTTAEPTAKTTTAEPTAKTTTAEPTAKTTTAKPTTTTDTINAASTTVGKTTTTAIPLKTTIVTTTKKTPLNKRCIDGEFRRHDDCGKYLRCAHGRLITKHCPATLHWNTVINACDWPFNAKCTLRTR